MKLFELKAIFLSFLFLSNLVFTSCESFEQKAAKIHNHAFTIDTHVDTPYHLLDKDFNIAEYHEYTPGGSRVDFLRMKEGGLDGIFFAAFTSQRDRTEENIQIAREKADELIDSIHSACKQHNQLAEVATSVEDGYRLEKEGKRAIYIGLENGFPIGTTISEVERYYDKG